MDHLLLSGSDWSLTGWNRNQRRTDLSIELGFAFNPILPTISAEVPGSVNTDLMRTGWLPDPNESMRSVEHEWVNNRDWLYARKFRIPEGWLKDKCELVCEGLDDKGELLLNGERIAAFEGMFTPVRVDVTSRLRIGEDNLLEVIFVPGEEVPGQVGYSNEIVRLKSRFNYGWDWMPRIVPVGIWKDVYLETSYALKLADYAPLSSIGDTGTNGSVIFHIETEVWRPGNYRFDYALESSDGIPVYEESEPLRLIGGSNRVRHSMPTPKVERWWPNGYGSQPLYTAWIRIFDDRGVLVCKAMRQIAFRCIVFMPNEGSPQDALPYTLKVNGKRIFMKGVNWVPVSPFYGAVRREDYELRLDRFKTMNTNLLRVWGGAVTETEDFYDYCDRNGLLVWQEFLQAASGLGNCPPDNAAFLMQLEQVSRLALLEKRTHPSLIAWCGGNELMWEQHRPVDERHANIAMLKNLVSELDPGRMFFPTSASGPRFMASEAEFGLGVHHDVHGPWIYLGEETHYRFFNHDDSLLHSEAGTPGSARAELLRKLAGGLQVWPPTADNAYWLHRGAWWIQWDQLGELFGPWKQERDETELFAQASRYMQMESLRYMAEAARRREPATSGLFVWMGHEPYANNINTSLLEYDGMPKPAYYAIKQAFATLHVSARYDKLRYRSGERFAVELFIHDEAETELAASFGITAELLDAESVLLASGSWENVNAGSVGVLEWMVEAVPNRLFLLRMRAIDGSDRQAINEYLFTTGTEYPLEPLRGLPQAKVELLEGDAPNRIVIANRSPVMAVNVFLIQADARESIHLSGNGFMLLPGERIVTESLNGPIAPERFYVEGFNL